MHSYTDFAQIYDELMERVPYEKWGAYIKAKLRTHLGKTAHRPIIADIACGTGVMTMELAKSGYDMIGIDISADMLTIAQQKCYDANQQVLFLCQDMRKLDLYGTVDAFICVCDGLNYILQPNELQNIFKRVQLFLNPGGVFIFDMNTEYKFKRQLGQRSFEDKSKSGVIYGLDNYYDENTKINEYQVEFYPNGKNGKSFSEIHKQRAYDSTEVLDMLKNAKFSTTSVFHDYTDMPPQEDCARFTYVGIL